MEKSFSSLKDKVSERTLKGIADMGLETMTEIQAKTIELLLDGKSAAVSAKTGSGKTLAFLIPAVELMYKLKFSPRNGTGVIIISPTRELSIQTYNVVKKVMKYHSQTHALIMGGGSRKEEAEKLFYGANVLVATPGRLLDHFKRTEGFLYKRLQCLVIDEADRLLESGFQKEMLSIIQLLPTYRQTLFFSATLPKKLKDLIGPACPLYISIKEKIDIATVDGLIQGFIICPSEDRLIMLYSFLKKYEKKKIIVFFSTCLSVKFHHHLLNYIGIKNSAVHGKMKQGKRSAAVRKFCKSKDGTLLCTNVAARGLDFPEVDWILQYDPPSNPKEYIHRVGRTARGMNKEGRAMLILRPEEFDFLIYLIRAKIPVKPFRVQPKHIAVTQDFFEKLVTRNYFFKPAGQQAYKSYIRAYQAHKLKKIFDVNTLDFTAVAKSFGFPVPPQVHI